MSKVSPTPAAFSAGNFRAELEKLMPSYSWTVHKSRPVGYVKATGTQSSGSNRLSTLRVERWEQEGKPLYEAKSAGYGLRAPWLHCYSDGTLARALRGLQDHYKQLAQTYRVHESDMERGRAPRPVQAAPSDGAAP